MAKNHFPHVYSPLQVRGMHLKNRIQYSPIVSNHADFETGEVNHELFEFVSGQARTGCALVTIGSTPIDFAEGRDFFGCLNATGPKNLHALAYLAREVHRWDCNLSAELTHAGQWGAGCLAMQDTDLKAIVPSVVEGWHTPDAFRECTRDDMDRIIQEHTAAIKLLKDAHFDSAMIHMAHGNLLSSFLSTVFNHRTDEYGGTPENRWRFPLEVLKACREAAGEDFPLEMRFQGNEWLEGGTPLEERIEFLKIAQHYIDIVVVSTGTLFTPPAMCYNMPGYYVPECCNVDDAAAFKEACPDLIVSVVGGITMLEQAEEIIASGKADMVAMAKALMADPSYVIKGEQGREEDIAPCLRCMYCMRQVLDTAHIEGCVNNPELGWEFRGPLTPTANDRKVMIVGGGPAGMMAARTLKSRGFSNVVLYEKSDELGGRLPEASAYSRKLGFRRYKDYVIKKTQECGARIVLGSEVTPAVIRQENPDVLLCAIGAKLIELPIPGLDQSVGVDAADRGDAKLGEHVVICGAGASGAECALHLAELGHKVTLLDQLPTEGFGNDIMFMHKGMLDAALQDDAITLIGNVRVEEITPDAVVVRSLETKDEEGFELIRIPYDSVVNALGMAPDKEAIEELTDAVPEAYVIGDAFRVATIGSATNKAYWVVRNL